MPRPQVGKPMVPQCRGPIGDAGLWFHAMVAAWAGPENRLDADPPSETTATAAAAPPAVLNSSRRVSSAMMLPFLLGLPLRAAAGMIEPSPGLAGGLFQTLLKQFGGHHSLRVIPVQPRRLLAAGSGAEPRRERLGRLQLPSLYAARTQVSGDTDGP